MTDRCCPKLLEGMGCFDSIYEEAARPRCCQQSSYLMTLSLARGWFDTHPESWCSTSARGSSSSISGSGSCHSDWPVRGPLDNGVWGNCAMIKVLERICLQAWRALMRSQGLVGLAAAARAGGTLLLQGSLRGYYSPLWG